MIIPLLQELEQESIKRGIPIIGSEKGSWLYSKVKELQPKRVLELGTAVGYSGIILGSEGAELTTIELDERAAAEAQENFEKFKINAGVLVGNAAEEVKKLVSKGRNHGKFDLIFIDHTKSQYREVLDDCFRLLRPGGLLIADNISFTGCQDFKEIVLSHRELKTEIVNIRDGMSCSQKLAVPKAAYPEGVKPRPKI